MRFLSALIIGYFGLAQAWTSSVNRQRQQSHIQGKALYAVDSGDGIDSSGTSSTMRRRDVLAAIIGASATVLLPRSSLAEELVVSSEQDLTSKLFNTDGSLKDETTDIEAKLKSIAINMNSSDDQLVVSIDGSQPTTISDTTALYNIPGKWVENYYDPQEKARACESIVVYKAAGAVNSSRLQKASTVGVGKALDVPDSLDRIRTGDLISGRTRLGNDGQKYYEFDVGVAPKTCENSKENLGLGFCPFDSIYLMSATVVDNKLYVLVVSCDKGEWKRASSDLKQVRSSFDVVVA